MKWIEDELEWWRTPIGCVLQSRWELGLVALKYGIGLGGDEPRNESNMEFVLTIGARYRGREVFASNSIYSRIHLVDKTRCRPV